MHRTGFEFEAGRVERFNVRVRVNGDCALSQFEAICLVEVWAIGVFVGFENSYRVGEVYASLTDCACT